MCEKATLHMDPVHLIFDVSTRSLAYTCPDPLIDIGEAGIQKIHGGKRPAGIPLI